MIRGLELTAAALSVLGLITMLVLVGRRLALARGDRRREAQERALRPLALELVDGEEPELTDVGDAEARALAAILSRYARKLRGEGRERITAFFEQRGDVERELDRLRSRNAARRATAAFALGDMGSPRGIEPLIAALDDPARDVRSSAARSLGMLEAQPAVPRLVQALAQREVPRAIAAGALLAIGSSAAAPLRSLLGDDDPGVRASAAELIGYTGDPGDAETLADSLRDSAAEVRAAAARSLGRLGARAAAAELREALGDPAPFVRTAAAHALGRIGDRDAFDALALVAQVDDYDPAQAAGAALATIDPIRTMQFGAHDGASAHLQEAAALADLELA
jgi:HEAT repeat protein